jgi:hypothetical protein
MRRHTLLTALTAAVLMASGCGEDESASTNEGTDVTAASTSSADPTPPSTTLPSPSPLTAAPPTSEGAPLTTLAPDETCAGDSIAPQGQTVQLKRTGESFESVTAERDLPCPAEISIDGGAAAHLAYVDIATCTIRQADDSQPANYLSKPSAGVFLQSIHGRADCILVGNEPRSIEYCGLLLTTDGGVVNGSCEDGLATAVSTNASTLTDRSGNVIQLAPNQPIEFSPFSPIDQAEICGDLCLNPPVVIDPNPPVGVDPGPPIDPNPPVVVDPIELGEQ